MSGEGGGGLPEILGHKTVGVLVLESEHPAPGVLYQQDLGGAEELLGDDDATEGVLGGGAGLEGSC